MSGTRGRWVGRRGALAGTLAVALMLLLPTVLGAGSAGAAGLLVGPNVSVPPAHCGPGSSPEHGVQGEVPLKDRQDGRSQLGYRCNLVLVGQHQGQGAGWQNAWYGNCDYYDTKTAADPADFPNGNGQISPGTQVIDVANPARPVLTANLNTPALDGPWESLKVNQARGLLAGVGGFGADGEGPLYFDVYDVKTDCAHPKLLASVPSDVPYGHEGNWAPDGMTYYAATNTLSVAAIDVSNPSTPRLLTVFNAETQPGDNMHGLSLSADGDTMYAAAIGGLQPGVGQNGIEIWNVSAIQHRAAAPVATHVGSVYWTDGAVEQASIPISYDGHPYLIAFDEGGAASTTSALGSLSGDPAGGARIIDIANPAAPYVISNVRLAIQTPKYAMQNAADIAGNGSFGYEAHYCSVDRQVNPTAMACGMFQSGIRVFDIRDPYQPREIAYFNPPAQVAKHGTLNGSEHDGGSTNTQPPNDTTDWCTSQIRFYTAADGSRELWAQCQDNGFMVLKFTNGAYPLPSLTTSALAGSAPASKPTGATKSPMRVAVLGESLPATGGSAGLPIAALVLVGAALVVGGSSRRLGPPNSWGRRRRSRCPGR